MTTKEKLIQDIIYAVEMNAVTKDNTKWETKHADGDLFFALAFRTEDELKQICKDSGIIIKERNELKNGT